MLLDDLLCRSIVILKQHNVPGVSICCNSFGVKGLLIVQKKSSEHGPNLQQLLGLFFFFLDRCRRRTQADFCGELELFAIAHDLDRDLVGRFDARHLVH